MSAGQTDHRKVYAKGFFDGLRMGEEMLTEQRQREKLDSLSTIERKVFESIPRMESWNAQKVGSEIYRKTRASVDMKAIGSALNKLLNVGLAVEGPKGQFRQSPVKPNQERVIMKIPASPQGAALTPAPTVSETSVDALGCIGAKLRIVAASLSEIAGDVDRYAIGLQEAHEQNASEVAKLRQLKELLGSLK